MENANIPHDMAERYRRWRASIPWTDAELAAAVKESILSNRKVNDYLRAKADRLEQWILAGHLTGRILGMALPILVTRCAICGKKALYRYGNSGRCSTHRMITSAAVMAYKRRVNQRGHTINQQLTSADRRARRLDQQRKRSRRRGQHVRRRET